MSSGWERIRLRVETNQPQQVPVSEDDDFSDTPTISSHVLDTSLGKAASNIPITLYRLENNTWQNLSRDVTNKDGRVSQFLSSRDFSTGIYKLHFDTSEYFRTNNVKSLFPFIEIVIDCQQGQHYHVPLLLNPFGYTTYRGT